MVKSVKSKTKKNKSIKKLRTSKAAQGEWVYAQIPRNAVKTLKFKLDAASGKVIIAAVGSAEAAKSGLVKRTRAKSVKSLGRSALTGQFVLKPASTGGSVSSAKVRQAIRSVIAAS